MSISGAQSSFGGGNTIKRDLQDLIYDLAAWRDAYIAKLAVNPGGTRYAEKHAIELSRSKNKALSCVKGNWEIGTPVKGQGEPPPIDSSPNGGYVINGWGDGSPGGTRTDSFLNPQQIPRQQEAWEKYEQAQQGQGQQQQGPVARNWLGWAQNAKNMGSPILAAKLYEEFLQDRGIDGATRISYQNAVLNELLSLYNTNQKLEMVYRERLVLAFALNGSDGARNNAYSDYKRFLSRTDHQTEADQLFQRLQPTLRVQPGSPLPPE